MYYITYNIASCSRGFQVGAAIDAGHYHGQEGLLTGLLFLAATAARAIGGRDVMLVTLAVPPHELLTDAELGRLLRLPPRLTAGARLIASHCTNREIADALGITDATARTHTSRLFDRLGISDRREVSAAIHRRVLEVLEPRRTARRAVRD